MVKSLAAVLEESSEFSPAVSQMHYMLLQIIDASNQDPQSAGPPADGAGSDDRLQREEIYLATKGQHKAWKQRGTKKHWVVRTCMNVAMEDTSFTKLQSTLRESVYVTPAAADQIRCTSLFNVLTYVPRDATFAASGMIGPFHLWIAPFFFATLC